jgi:hypothetical protein
MPSSADRIPITSANSGREREKFAQEISPVQMDMFKLCA